MKILVFVLGLLLILGGCSGCMIQDDDVGPLPPPPPVPPPPVPPPPVPPPPVPPLPDTVSAAIFDDIAVGDPASELEALPPPERLIRTDGNKTIHSWVLDEKRPEGGNVRWEVHVIDEKITASFKW